MYTLKESTEYALSTEGKSNKTFLFVKLTDSALQSILSLKSQVTHFLYSYKILLALWSMSFSTFQIKVCESTRYAISRS